MKSYFNLKRNLLFVLFILFQSYSFAQSGLNKSKDELISFIRRPAFASLYPEVTIDDNSIIVFSKDLKKGVFYNFNSFNRCNGEVMSERLNSNNFESTLSFLKAYLKLLNYEKDYNTENVYRNASERITASIEKNDGWLNIVFKKY
ncbi:hypothetical protein [Daejeonella sp. H1SJ63]|uniref:hypothetical protein n=1 Tax=Daejeonella sp. H1SJ63 TaxID=3034145 RepID=UPI0023EC3CBC|nr:hypothetical protein [Daejeonella sp. H1SJ63]